MGTLWSGERLVREIERLAARGLRFEEFCVQASDRLRRGLEIDGACWHVLDAQTLLMTSDMMGDLVAHDLLPAEYVGFARHRIVTSEYVEDDFNTFAELARRRRPTGTLGEATRGHPDRSPRYAQLMAPLGGGFELRGALRARKRTWGGVVLIRQQGNDDFSSRDASLLARLSKPLAEGLRLSLLASAAYRSEPSAPGLVVLGPQNELELMTPAARQYFVELNPQHVRPPETLPSAVLTLAATTREGLNRDAATPARGIQVLGHDGWLSLHASVAEGMPGRVAVIIERARSEDTVAVRLDAYGLTPREQEITGLLVRGFSSSELAGKLVLSPHTVRDHLKSILEKTGTRNRRELVAQVFFADYFPSMQEEVS